MAVVLLGSCDLVTPDEIINPNVDESTFLKSDNPMETWVNGSEKEFALHMSDFVELMEILSDNYFNNYTRSSKVFDVPQLLYTDADVTKLQRHVGALREMADYGFEMEKTAQGPFTWSQPMKELGCALTEHKVNYNNNPILRWCLANTGVKALNKDGIETIQPVKLQQDRRIDGMVSLLNAWVGYVKHLDDYLPYVR